jgi:hypothetical protein
MSVFPTGAQLRYANFGVIVTGAAKTIPQTATQTIFTVSGGRILLTSLIGQVTTVIGATVTTLSVGVTPSGGALAAAALCTASAITSAVVGSFVAVQLTITNALIVSGASGVLQAGSSAGSGLGDDIMDGGIAIVSAGVINVTTSASTTGAIAWAMTYVPWDTGAAVVAA